MSTAGVKTGVDKFIEEVVNAALTNDATLLTKVVEDNKEFSLTRSFSGKLSAVNHVGKTGNKAACDLILREYVCFYDLLYGAAYGGQQECALYLLNKSESDPCEYYQIAALAALDGEQLELCEYFLKHNFLKTDYNKVAFQAIDQGKYGFAEKILLLAKEKADYNGAASRAAKNKQNALCVKFLKLAGSRANYRRALETALSDKNAVLARSINELANENGRKVVDKRLAFVAAGNGLDMALELLASSGAEIIDYLDAANAAGREGHDELQRKMMKVRESMISRKCAITPLFNAVSTTSTSGVAELRQQLASAIARITALEIEVNKLKPHSESSSKRRKIG